MPPHADVAQTVEMKEGIAFKRREFAAPHPARRYAGSNPAVCTRAATPMSSPP